MESGEVIGPVVCGIILGVKLSWICRQYCPPPNVCELTAVRFQAT